MATLVLTRFAIFLFLLFFLSFESLLGWQILIRFAVKIRHRTTIIVSVDPSQKQRVNRSPRSAFRMSDEEEALGTCVLVPLARIGAGLIIGSHRIRDGLNTCASRSLSSSRISSCRAVTNPPFFAVKGVIHIKLLRLATTVAISW